MAIQVLILVNKFKYNYCLPYAAQMHNPALAFKKPDIINIYIYVLFIFICVGFCPCMCGILEYGILGITFCGVGFWAVGLCPYTGPFAIGQADNLASPPL